jgi:hypothetical protein
VSTGNLKINPVDVNKNMRKNTRHQATTTNNKAFFVKTQQQQYNGNNDKQHGNGTGTAPS